MSYGDSGDLSTLRPGVQTPQKVFYKEELTVTPSRTTDQVTYSSGSSNGFHHHGYAWGWLSTLIFMFIICVLLFWLVLYSLRPPWVMKKDGKEVDTAKVLLWAVVISLIIVILYWLIKASLGNRI